MESQDLKGAFERIIPVVFWTVIALVGILMLALAWRGTLREQARDRELCEKICTPAVSVYSPRQGCFCEGSNCRRF